MTFNVIFLLQWALIPLMSPLVVGIIRKLKAKMQNRQGASIWQPYYDLRKLFGKDEIISRDASWIFRAMPYILFTTTLVVSLCLPLLTTAFNSVAGDFLIIIYTLGLGTFFLALAGIDTGNAFGGFGSSREMTLAALAEGGFIFAMLTLAITAHSTNLITIVNTVTNLPSTSYLPMLLAFGGFFIILLAETGRFPFDNPATHLELTMIHEAMILEYSGRRLALIEWAAANKLLIFMTIGANLFFPWGIAHTLALPALGLALIVYIIKLLVLSSAIALIESSLAKYRFFRLPELLFTSFILSIIAIGLLA